MVSCMAVKCAMCPWVLPLLQSLWEKYVCCCGLLLFTFIVAAAKNSSSWEQEGKDDFVNAYVLSLLSIYFRSIRILIAVLSLVSIYLRSFLRGHVVRGKQLALKVNLSCTISWKVDVPILKHFGMYINDQLAIIFLWKLHSKICVANGFLS